MATDRNVPDSSGETENGVLADTGKLDTAGIGIISGGTAHVDVSLPLTADEDDFAEDGVVDEDAHTSEIILDLDAGRAQVDAVADVAASAGATDAVRVELGAVAGVAALFNMLFFIYPGPLVGAATAAAKSLF